eukprot:TRINITY_DN66083_c9_g5_i1.p1 TRINITY_DN66083_c9_g5~~TRINITY_DN66083_c9_g5_i1.p1  ORF type:complete len:906 (+),score=442.87 TRINITY_DN66083_c9_g5_i1:42-2759(+)
MNDGNDVLLSGGSGRDAFYEPAESPSRSPRPPHQVSSIPSSSATSASASASSAAAAAAAAAAVVASSSLESAQQRRHHHQQQQQQEPVDELHDSLLHLEQRESFAVNNLDAFFTHVYQYFVENGFWPMIVSRLTNLLSLLFTILFSTFLLIYVDWSRLLRCADEENCVDAVGIHHDVLKDPSFGQVLVLMYFAVFSVYWVWNVLSFVYSIRAAMQMRYFFGHYLQLRDEDISTVHWHTVTDRIVALQERVKLSIVKDMNALDIENRIMRRDNFMVALINCDILDLRVPWCSPMQSFQPGRFQPAFDSRYQALDSMSPRSKSNKTQQGGGSTDSRKHRVGSGSSSSSSSQSGVPKSPFSKLVIWGRSMEWNIRFCILNPMFDQHFTIRPSFLGAAGIRRLKSRLFWVGVLNFVLMPFIMVFMIIFFFLQHAERFHSKKEKEIMGPREWTPLAKWKLRELNELPHFFEQRLAASSDSALKYVEQFPRTVVSLVAQFVAYVCGAFVAVLVLLTFSDSSILINIKVWDRELLWWLAIFSTVLAISRAFVSPRNVLFQPNTIMAQVAQYTHYMPRHWVGRCHTRDVYQEFCELYDSRVKVFVNEVVSVVLTPFILCFNLPDCAEDIVNFVRTASVNVEGVGDVCSFALFDLEQNGNSEYLKQAAIHLGGAGTADASGAATNATGDGDDNTKADGHHLTSRNGKMEQSFITFAVNHPNWRISSAVGNRMLSSVVMNAERQQMNMSQSLMARRQRSFDSASTASIRPVKFARASSDDSLPDEDDILNASLFMTGSPRRRRRAYRPPTQAGAQFHVHVQSPNRHSVDDDDDDDHKKEPTADAMLHSLDQYGTQSQAFMASSDADLQTSFSQLLDGWRSSDVLPSTMSRMEASAMLHTALLLPSVAEENDDSRS